LWLFSSIVLLNSDNGTWTARVNTSNAEDSAHSAKVVMVVYGSKGKSEELLLENGQKNYQKGKADDFKVCPSLLHW
jgi:hypothetical protein